MYIACIYKLKWKPLFDGLVLGVLNIKGQLNWVMSDKVNYYYVF